MPTVAVIVRVQHVFRNNVASVNYTTYGYYTASVEATGLLMLQKHLEGLVRRRLHRALQTIIVSAYPEIGTSVYRRSTMACS